MGSPQPVLHHGPALRLLASHHQRPHDQDPTSCQSNDMAILPPPILCHHLCSLSHRAGDRIWNTDAKVLLLSLLFWWCELLRTCLPSRFWYSCSNLMWGICLFWLIFACCRGYGGDFRRNVWRNKTCLSGKLFLISCNMFFAQAPSMISSHGADGARLQR